MSGSLAVAYFTKKVNTSLAKPPLTLLMLGMEYSGFGVQYYPCWCPGSEVAKASAGMELAVWDR